MKKEGVAPRKHLTDKQVRHMKTDGKRLEVPAGPPKGLYLVVQPTGKKSWAFRYRWKAQPKKLTFKDPYPDVTLAAARAEAEAAREDVRNGIDPAVREDQVPTPKPPDTVAVVAQEWLNRAVKGQETAAETERIMRRYVLPEWKSRPIEEIGKADALRLLDALCDRGVPVQANRVLNALRRFFNWTVERGILETSPVAGIRPPGQERSRERVLTDEELAAVWQAADAVGYPFGPFVRLLILTVQRRGELAAMTWEHLDLENALWTLPRTKAGRVHDVPLSGAALDILERLPRFTKGDLVFTTTSGQKPLAGWSKFKSRLDRALVADGADVKPWTVHDLRRTAATHMAARNVPPHVLAAILNHSPGRTMGISAVYIRHRYLAERREALEAWAAHLLRLVDAKVQVASMG